jgi:hypothetical protein
MLINGLMSWLVGFFAVSHRHMVFTMPEEFRVVFEVDQSLFKVLMDAVSNTMQ